MDDELAEVISICKIIIRYNVVLRNTVIDYTWQKHEQNIK